MASELHSRLTKKKGAVIFQVQNSTEVAVQVTSSSMSSGKFDKSTPMPSVFAPLSSHEIGMYQPEGQWAFALENDLNQKTRLTILHGAEHANIEKLPSTASWTASLEQDWKTTPPHILVTFLPMTKTSPNPTSAPKEEKKKKAKSPSNDGSTDIEIKKKKKASKAARGETDSATVSSVTNSNRVSTDIPSESNHQSQPSSGRDGNGSKKAPSLAAFGIDAEMMNQDSDSSEDEGNSVLRKKISVVINRSASTAGTREQEGTSEDLIRRASMLQLSNKNGPLASPGNIPNVSNNFQSNPSSAFGNDDDDFFKEMDQISNLQNRSVPATTANSNNNANPVTLNTPPPTNSGPGSSKSSRHASMPAADREKKLSQIPPSAISEFEKSMEHLDAGRILESKNSVNAALTQLNDLAITNNPVVVKQWCIYVQMTTLLLEMKRLESEGLYNQRALLARFVGELGLSGISREKHILICLRIAINRNLEMENYNTSYNFLKVMSSMAYVKDQERANIEQKMQKCEQAGIENEKHSPLGASLDHSTGQYRINGKPYVLCFKSLQLIRDSSYLQCPYCSASFSVQNSSSKCSICGTKLNVMQQ